MIPKSLHTLDFITDVILISYCHPKVSECCHILIQFLSYPHILVPS
jgi:hypothetical protein